MMNLQRTGTLALPEEFTERFRAYEARDFTGTVFLAHPRFTHVPDLEPSVYTTELTADDGTRWRIEVKQPRRNSRVSGGYYEVNYDLVTR